MLFHASARSLEHLPCPRRFWPVASTSTFSTLLQLAAACRSPAVLVYHISPERERHETLLAATIAEAPSSVWGFGYDMHSGSSVLCSHGGHVPRRHLANIHNCLRASSRGWTCTVEDGLPEQLHTLFNSAYISPKFGGLHAISTPCGVHFIDHVSARAHKHKRAHTCTPQRNMPPTSITNLSPSNVTQSPLPSVCTGPALQETLHVARPVATVVALGIGSTPAVSSAPQVIPHCSTLAATTDPPNRNPSSDAAGGLHRAAAQADTLQSTRHAGRVQSSSPSGCLRFLAVQLLTPRRPRFAHVVSPQAQHLGQVDAAVCVR